MNNEKLIELELLNQQLTELENSILLSEDQIFQLESAKEALKSLQSGQDEVLIPITSGILLPIQKIDLTKIKILVGSNIVVEKNSKETILKIDEYLIKIKEHREKSIQLFDKISIKLLNLQKELDGDN